MYSRISLVLCVSLLYTTAGCTSYVPRPSSSIRMVMDGGSSQFVKNGAVIQKGALGGSLIEAMKDVPAAQQHARTYRAMNIAGFTVYGVGLLGMVIGGLIWPVSKNYTVPVALIGSGGGLGVIGLGVVAGSGPQLLDAINLYNDSIEPDSKAPVAPLRDPTVCVATCGKDRQSCSEGCGRSEKCKGGCVDGYNACVKACSN